VGRDETFADQLAPFHDGAVAFTADSPQAYLAGTAYDGPRPYYVGKGATGFGVRLLVELVESLAVGGRNARCSERRNAPGAAPHRHKFPRALARSDARDFVPL
jgi:hypothetical protein